MTVAPNAALILIDVQQGMDDPRLGSRNNGDAEHHMAALLSAWRDGRRPVIHVQHMSCELDSPFRPERPGNAFKVEATPLVDEPVFQKQVNSAFSGTDLESYLRQQGIQDLISANLGFAVTVVADATATFDRVSYDGASFDAEQMHQAALASLHSEFATVRRSQELLSAVSAPGA
jgi:nicotinamidase-related amidase